MRTPEFCRRVGATYRQVDYWARTGLLVPGEANADGSGTNRVYAEADVLPGRILAAWSSLATTPAEPRHEALQRALRAAGDGTGPRWLVMGTEVATTCQGDALAIALATYGPSAVVFDLWALRHDLISRSNPSGTP